MDKLLDASCHVAFAGLIHDTGKFIQRASLEIPKNVRETHYQLYCPKKKDGYWTHLHAAWTALGFDAIEQTVPDLLQSDAYPFDSRTSTGEGSKLTNTLVNVAARHHAPDGFLDWVIATADRVASGFEREDFEDETKDSSKDKGYIRTRLLSLLEEVSLDGREKFHREDLQKGHVLEPFCAASIFPTALAQIEASNLNTAIGEYRHLWEAFTAALAPDSVNAIPAAFRKNWPLWIDVFDTAWLTYTQNIPSATAFGVKPDVSLYDHSKTTAALATALWRWHEEMGRTNAAATVALRTGSEKNVKKFLLVQGDFFGIQNFIFSEGSETNRQSTKVLRGRSFYVSLLTELAALRVLEALHLPSTSQIINAAGKFLIVAPNTPATHRALDTVRKELSEWFLKNTFATSGIGIVAVDAACTDFSGQKYTELLDRLHAALETAKYQRFDLVHLENPVFDADFSHGVCAWQSRLPADGKLGTAGEPSCALSRDEILIGASLVNFTRLLVLDKDADIHTSEHVRVCELPIFGYRIAFTQDRDTSGCFSAFAASGKLHRCWDFSLPTDEREVLWKGFARRNINGYVPRYNESDFTTGGLIQDAEAAPGRIKTFEHIAASGSFDGKGVKCLMTLKGDVDSLGLIFRKGLAGTTKNSDRVMTFAKTATLSRQMNAFFAVYLPVLCAKRFPNMYTVFSGGDDFFLIGPWREAQHLGKALNQQFAHFAAGNPEVHFSVGLVMTKPFVPVRTLSENAEEALSSSKAYKGKNAVTIHGETIPWSALESLNEMECFLVDTLGTGDATTSYLYGLFRTLEMAGDTETPESAMWRSRLYYTTTRLFERNRLNGNAKAPVSREEFITKLVLTLEKQGSAFRIPLSNVFYSLRKSR